jgi:ribose transport system substrate-binding protein
MNIAKRWLFMVCIGILAPASSVAESNTRIAFIPGQITDDFYISVYQGAKRAADVLGIDLIYEGSPEWSVSEQIKVLNNVKD